MLGNLVQITRSVYIDVSPEDKHEPITLILDKFMLPAVGRRQDFGTPDIRQGFNATRLSHSDTKRRRLRWTDLRVVTGEAAWRNSAKSSVGLLAFAQATAVPTRKPFPDNVITLTAQCLMSDILSKRRRMCAPGVMSLEPY